MLELPQPALIVAQRIDLEMVPGVEESRNHDVPFPRQGAGRGGLDDRRLECHRFATRKLSGVIEYGSEDRFATCLDLDWGPVRVGVEIDEHLPDDLARSLDHDFRSEQCQQISP